MKFFINWNFVSFVFLTGVFLSLPSPQACGFVLTQRKTVDSAKTADPADSTPPKPENLSPTESKSPPIAPPPGLRYTYEKGSFYLTLDQSWLKLVFFDQEGQPAPSPFKEGFLDLKILNRRTTGSPSRVCIPLVAEGLGLKALRVVAPPYRFQVGLRLQPQGGGEPITYPVALFNASQLGLLDGPQSASQASKPSPKTDETPSKAPEVHP